MKIRTSINHARSTPRERYPLLCNTEMAHMVSTKITGADAEESREAVDAPESPAALSDGKYPHRGDLNTGPDPELPRDPHTTSNALTVLAPSRDEAADRMEALCSEIKKNIRIGEKKTAESLNAYFRAGACLEQAKEIESHGKYNAWVKRHFDFSPSWCAVLREAAGYEAVWPQAIAWAAEVSQSYQCTPRGVVSLCRRYEAATKSQVGQEEKKRLRAKTAKEKLAEAEAKIARMKSAAIELISELTAAGRSIDAAMFGIFELDPSKCVRPRQTRRLKPLEITPGLFDAVDAEDASGGAS